MRTGAGFDTTQDTASGTPFSSPVGSPHQVWQSPVPYLFGGLGAMVGLIALALLILACSYWKLSGYFDGEDGGYQDRGGDGKQGENGATVVTGYVQQFVVIMAGDQNPTFVATPIACVASSIRDNAMDTSDKNIGVHDGMKNPEVRDP